MQELSERFLASFHNYTFCDTADVLMPRVKKKKKRKIERLTTKVVVSTSLLFIKISLTCSHFRPSWVTNLENVTLGFPYLQGMIEVRSGPLVYR